METMGILSLLPPILAIILAFTTKQVMVSLFAAIWVGATMVYGWNPVTGLMGAFSDFIFPAIGNTDNSPVLVMTVFCGSFSYLLENGGGAKVFAETLASKVKGRKGAQILTAVGGTVIFFSDSTNPVLIGPVFKPLTDKMLVSREKLAYIVDSTSATMPSMFFFTAWGAYILTIVAQQLTYIGDTTNAVIAFNQAVPFMFYTIGAVLMVYFIGITGFDYGPMAAAEKRAAEEGKVVADEHVTDRLIRKVVIPEGATPHLSSMVVPLVTLVVCIFAGLLYTGGFPERNVIDALANCSTMKSLVTAFFVATVVAAIYTIKDKVYTVTESITAIMAGITQMMEACVILTLAWSIGSVCKAVGTTAYVISITESWLTPAMMFIVLFVVSAFTAFCTGTSWGTFSIYLPISIPLAAAIGAPIAPAIGLVISGGIFGDHCSPISDTTVLSSIGSSCDHIAHVGTQLVYALTVAACAAVAYLFVGLTFESLGLYVAAAIGIVITVLGSWAVATIAHKATVKK